MNVDWPVVWLVKHRSIVVDVRDLDLDSSEGGEWRRASITSFNNNTDWRAFRVKLSSVIDEQGSCTEGNEKESDIVQRKLLSKCKELHITFFWNLFRERNYIRKEAEVVYHCWGQCRNPPGLMTSLCRWSFRCLQSPCQLLLLWQLHCLVACAQAELPRVQRYFEHQGKGNK